MTTRYKRSAFCLLHWDGPALCALNCHTFRMFRGAERYVTTLHHLSEWTTAPELAQRLGTGDQGAAQRALDRLVAMDLVVDDPAAPGADGTGGWDLVELALQRQAAVGGYDPATAPAGRPPPAFKARAGGPVVPLARQPLADGRSLGEVLDQRRTRRSYADTGLALDDLATFLWSVARVVRRGQDPLAGEPSRRPYPSGGGRYPLEIYAVANDVPGLGAGAYHYDPLGHQLSLVMRRDGGQDRLNAEVTASTLGGLNREPPVVLLITAVFARTTHKYDRIGLSLILKDVGCLYQTMYLVATAMGLAPCAIGGGAEADNARWLGLDPLVESQVGAFLLGRPV